MPPKFDRRPLRWGKITQKVSSKNRPSNLKHRGTGSVLAKWLYPGLEVKRWLGILVIGIFALSLGIAYFITHLYRTQPFPEFAYYVTLQFIDRPYRALLFGILGVGV